MKEIQVTKFQAADGTIWDTEKVCKEHESDTLAMRVSRIDVAEIEGAMRYDPELRQLAADLEAVGKRCAEARIAAGDVKRKRKEKRDGATVVDKTEPETTGDEPVVQRPVPERDRVLTKYATKDNPFPNRDTREVPSTIATDGAPF